MESRCYCLYGRGLQRKGKVIVHKDGAKSRKEVALFIQTELREKRKGYSSYIDGAESGREIALLI